MEEKDNSEELYSFRAKDKRDFFLRHLLMILFPATILLVTFHPDAQSLGVALSYHIAVSALFLSAIFLLLNLYESVLRSDRDAREVSKKVSQIRQDREVGWTIAVISKDSVFSKIYLFLGFLSLLLGVASLPVFYIGSFLVKWL